MANSSTGINTLTNTPLLGINLGSHANARQIVPGEAGNQGNRWKATEPVLINDSNSISGAAWSAIHLANFHQKLVQSCDDPMVLGWGLGNEPYAQTTPNATDYITADGMNTLYINTMNTVLKYLRNSSKKPVFICGLQYASARNWKNTSKDLQEKIVEPANSIVWEVHGYGDIDSGSSGAYNGDNTQIQPGIFTKAPEAGGIFTPMFKYASDNNMATYLGEVGIPSTDAARMALKNLLDRPVVEQVPATLWITGPSSDAEKMSLERSDHAATVALVAPYFAKRLSHWNYSAS